MQEHFEKERKHAVAIKQVLGPHAYAILVQTAQGKFAVPAEDLYVGAQLRFQGAYRQDELDYLKTICHSTTRLLVVGAHIGALVVPLARLCYRVVAIDANPEIFKLLQLNIAMNDISNCLLYCHAASDREEKIEFLLSRINSGGSKRRPRENWFYFHDNPEVVEVEASALDALLPDDDFDVIVMDIEGSEYFALKGMQRILQRAAVLQVEFLPHHLSKVAGVTPEEFLQPIEKHFCWMFVPTKGVIVPKDKIQAVLAEMFERNEEDESILFFKEYPELAESLCRRS